MGSRMRLALLAATYAATSAKPVALGQDAKHPLLVQRRKPFAGIKASNVSAVMCLGDSWQTGMNAADVTNLATAPLAVRDYRGGSFGCGSGFVTSDTSHTTTKEITTLGMLLKRFNPQLEGISKGTTMFEVPCDLFHQRAQCGLNAAMDGAALIGRKRLAASPLMVTKDLKEKATFNNSMYEQARNLVRWVHKESPHLLSSWKVLTFIPAWGDQWFSRRSTKKARYSLRQILELVRSELPYTYVNIIALADEPSRIHESFKAGAGGSTWCRLAFNMWYKRGGADKYNGAAGADEWAAQLNRAFLKLAEQFDDGQSLVVRFQPMLRGLQVQMSLMDGLTCFHPSPRLIGEMGLGLLQNMLAPSTAEQMHTLPSFGGNPAQLRAATSTFTELEREVRTKAARRRQRLAGPAAGVGGLPIAGDEAPRAEGDWADVTLR